MPNSRKNILSIVLPCFNEERAIRPALRALVARSVVLAGRAGVDAVELIVVDDGSTDGSAAELGRFADSVRVVAHPRRRGYGAALKTGFAAASGEYIGFFDIDATYEPFDLVPMLERLRRENVALVVGNRLGDLRNMPITRRVGNLLFRSLISLLYGCVSEDACSGLRVFRRASLAAFTTDLPDQLNYSLAMSLRSMRAGIGYAEIPIRYYRRVGPSKLNVPKDGFRFLLTILWYRLRRHPRAESHRQSVIAGAPGK